MERGENGFGLIELLVVMLILGIVTAMTSSLFAQGTRTFSRETTAVDLHSDVAAAKNIFLDDVSVAGFRPDGAPADPNFGAVTAAGTTLDGIEILADIDSDGDTDRICYRVTGATLERHVQDAAGACPANDWTTLAENVTRFNATFLDADHATVLDDASAPGAFYVQVEITLGTQAKGGPVTRTIFGEVAIRNPDA